MRRVVVCGSVAASLAFVLLACDKAPEPRLIAADGVYRCTDVDSARILVIVDGGAPSSKPSLKARAKVTLDSLKADPPKANAVKATLQKQYGKKLELLNVTPESLTDEDKSMLLSAAADTYPEAYTRDTVPDHTIEDKELRRRAALLCACRAERERSASRTSGAVSDTLIVSGLVGAAAGGVFSALSANADPGTTTQNTTRDIGVVTLAAGAVLASVGGVLKLNDRSASTAAASSDQEIAAAILLNDLAGSAAWSRAYAVCVTAENAGALSRATESTSPPSFGAPDGGVDDASADATPTGAATATEAGTGTSGTTPAPPKNPK